MSDSKTNTEIIYKWINTVESEVSKRCDFTEITKLLDQFKLLKKIVLRDGQCLLLKNTDLKMVTEKHLMKEVLNHDADDPNEHRYQVNLADLQNILDYLKLRNDNGLLSHVDKLLINYLPYEIKEKIFSNINSPQLP